MNDALSGMKVRLNFLVRPEVRDLLESLEERTGADSMTEVLRLALSAYDWLVRYREEGFQMCVRRGRRSAALSRSYGYWADVELPSLAFVKVRRHTKDWAIRCAEEVVERMREGAESEELEDAVAAMLRLAVVRRQVGEEGG